jgi:hypothetical protein
MNRNILFKMLVARLKLQNPRDDYLIDCINPELQCLKGFSPGDESEEDLNKWLDEIINFFKHVSFTLRIKKAIN